MKRIAGLGQWIGPAGFVVVTIIQFARFGSDGWKVATLENALVWLVGVAGIVMASGHMFFAAPVAESIGWPTHTPWQFEIAVANLSYGVLGIWCGFTDDRGFWLATIVAISIFLLGAAVGHVREMVTKKNFHPGNAGAIFYSDLAIPAVLIALYLITS